MTQTKEDLRKKLQSEQVELYSKWQLAADKSKILDALLMALEETGKCSIVLKPATHKESKDRNTMINAYLPDEPTPFYWYLLETRGTASVAETKRLLRRAKYATEELLKLSDDFTITIVEN